MALQRVWLAMDNAVRHISSLRYLLRREKRRDEKGPRSFWKKLRFWRDSDRRENTEIGVKRLTFTPNSIGESYQKSHRKFILSASIDSAVACWNFGNRGNATDNVVEDSVDVDSCCTDENLQGEWRRKMIVELNLSPSSVLDFELEDDEEDDEEERRLIAMECLLNDIESSRINGKSNGRVMNTREIIYAYLSEKINEDLLKDGEGWLQWRPKEMVERETADLAEQLELHILDSLVDELLADIMM